VQPVYVGEPLARALYQLVIFLWLGSELYHGMRVFVRIARAGRGVGPVRQDRFADRISVEEKALANGLGQPYRDYMHRTKRLIPFVL